MNIRVKKKKKKSNVNVVIIIQWLPLVNAASFFIVSGRLQIIFSQKVRERGAVELLKKKSKQLPGKLVREGIEAITFR